MKEIDWENVGTYAVFIALVCASVPLLHRLPRTKGKNPIFHGAYLAVAAAILLLLPETFQDDIFSPGGVVIVGTILPIYESIVAVCSPGEQDDAAWLQYWIATGCLSYGTEFIDVIRDWFPQGGEHWYEFEFFFTLWLLLPFTDGASLIYHTFTEPYIAPTCQGLKKKCEGYMTMILAVVNSSYMYLLWFTFMSLPEEARRFVAVAVGTIYPMIASTVALTTNTGDKAGFDDTYWLTYWACFSILFLAMDYLENFVGSIPGFYSLILMATVYLFLPMFNGAEAVFRNVLVPLSGQYENMLLHDAYLVRLGMEKKIPVKYHETVFQRAADVFLKKSK
jgi:hypothetical protein